MKKRIISLCFSLVVSIGYSQTLPVPEHDSVFRSGTFLGKRFPDIRGAQIFGEPSSVRASIGRFNVPHRFEFHDRFSTQNPYSTEVGFDHRGEVAYFLVRKRSLASGQRMQDGEILPMMAKIARGGEWKLLSGATDGDRLYEYTHVYKRTEGDKVVQQETFKAYAHVPDNRQLIFAYTPFVSPNLAELDAGRSFRFASGEQLTLSEGEQSSGASVTFIDSEAPPELKAQLASKAPEARQLALDSLSRHLKMLEESGDQNVYLLPDSQLGPLKEALKVVKDGKGEVTDGRVPPTKTPAFSGIPTEGAGGKEMLEERAREIIEKYRGEIIE